MLPVQLNILYDLNTGVTISDYRRKVYGSNSSTWELSESTLVGTFTVGKKHVTIDLNGILNFIKNNTFPSSKLIFVGKICENR